jgi:hypothetical protein
MAVKPQDVARNFLSGLGSRDPSTVSLETILNQLLDLQKRVTALEELQAA